METYRNLPNYVHNLFISVFFGSFFTECTTADQTLAVVLKCFKINCSICLQNCQFGGFLAYLTAQTAILFSGSFEPMSRVNSS